MAYTSGNDINVLQATDTAVVGAGAGDDRYVLSPNLLTANQVITISDTQGANTLQLIGGLTITSSKVAATSVQLVLSNGATVNVLGADSFTFQIGGDGLSGVGGTKQTFAQFAASLGVATLPTGTTVSSGSANVGVNTDGTTTGGGSSGGFTLASSAVSVDEGKTVTFTLTAPSTSTSDRSFDLIFAGSTNGDTPGINKATADDVSGVGAVVIKAGETKGTLTVTAVGDNVAEGLEGFILTTLDSNFKAIATSNTVVIKDATVDKVLPVVKTGQIINFPENQAKNALLGTVTATDETVAGTAGTISTFEITAGNADGFFAIGADGKITLTEAGAAAGKASNDFETTPNAFTLKVVATDAVGNKSVATDVVLNVTNVDDDAPKFKTALLSNNQIVITFDEALDATAVPATSAFTGTVTAGGVTNNLNVTNVGISGSTVILTLAAAPGANATVKVSYAEPASGPLKDVVGNKVAAINNQSAQVDSTAPTLSSSTPADDATNVAVTDNLVLTFSETVKAGTGNIVIVNSQDSSDNRTISISDTTQVTLSGNTVTVNPTADLKTGATYYVSIGAGVVTDVVGNAYAGITTTTALNFSTPGAVTTGSSFTLKQGQDTVAGTAANDSIDGFLDGGNVTWQSTDVIDGGAGTDTLTALGMTGALDFTQVKNVEKFVIGTGAAGVTIDFSKTGAETALTLQNTAQTVDATNLNMSGNGFDLALNGTTANNTFNFATTSTGGSGDVVRLALNGVTAGTLGIDNANNAIEVLSITGSGANSKPGAMALSGALKTINIDGSVRVDLTNTGLAAAVTKVDASGSTGGVRINNSVQDNTFTFTGGSGDDMLNMGNGWVTSADTLVGGAGTDTLIINTTALAAADLTNVSGFEIFGVAGANTPQTWSTIASKFANRASINSAHTITLNSISTGLVVDVNATGATVVLGGLASSSASDAATVNLGASDGGFTLADLQVNTDVETITLNSQGSAANTLTTVSTARSNLTLTGGTALTVTGTGTLAGTLDASAMTGGLTATTSTTALVVLGGTAADTLTTGNVAAATTQTINGNGGNDTITAAAAATATAIVNLNGGEGNDTITGPGAAAVTGFINGGAGIDAINVGGSTVAFEVRSDVVTVANADIISNFTTTVEKFKYSGAIVNGSTTSLGAAGANVSVQAAGASLNADLAAGLAANTSSGGYILQGNLAGAAGTALTNLAGATASTLSSLYTTFETELVTALAGAVSGLDTVLATTDKVLLVLDNGAHSVALYITNNDQSTSNTLTAAEIDLVGVFNGTAALAAADLIA